MLLTFDLGAIATIDTDIVKIKINASFIFLHITSKIFYCINTEIAEFK
jgi:hypothetical protein